MSDTQSFEETFDGIELGQQQAPRWWMRFFVCSVLFSPLYFAMHHFGAEGRSIHDKYDIALAENTRMQFAEIGDLEADETTLVRFMHKPDWMKVGKMIFKKHCVSCHGNSGEGKVGPNLTDKYFKNIRKIEDIARVINNGANGNAMPAWATKLHPNEVVLLSSYVASLRGTNAESGRMPEGGEIAPWPQSVPEEAPESTPEQQASVES